MSLRCALGVRRVLKITVRWRIKNAYRVGLLLHRLTLEQMRIVGGHELPYNSTPWMAALYANGSLDCGGSLIAPEWVLVRLYLLPSPVAPISSPFNLTVFSPHNAQTAAHCVDTSHLGTGRIEGQSLNASRAVLLGGTDRSNISAFETHQISMALVGIQAGFRCLTCFFCSVTPQVL